MLRLGVNKIDYFEQPQWKIEFIYKQSVQKKCVTKLNYLIDSIERYISLVNKYYRFDVCASDTVEIELKFVRHRINYIEKYILKTSSYVYWLLIEV